MPNGDAHCFVAPKGGGRWPLGVRFVEEMPVRVTVLVGPAVDDLTNPHATRPHTRRYERDDDDDGHRVADVIHPLQ